MCVPVCVSVCVSVCVCVCVGVSVFVSVCDNRLQECEGELPSTRLTYTRVPRLDYRGVYVYIYIYVCVCMCVCFCSSVV